MVKENEHYKTLIDCNKQLEKILIPYPVSDKLKNEYAEINTKLCKSLSQKYAAENSIESQINILENFKI